MLAELLTEDEIRLRKARILHRLPEERRRLSASISALRAVQHRAWLAISLLRDDLLHTDEAKRAMLDFKVAIQAGESKPLIKEDKVAILGLDIGDLQLEYELAKMAVESSEADYKMLNDETIWYSSIRKQTGAHVPMEQQVNALYEKPTIDSVMIREDFEKMLAEVEHFVPPTIEAGVSSGGEIPTEPIDYSRPPEHFAPTPMFPANPKAETILDQLLPAQLERIQTIGDEKNINVDSMCWGLMNCAPAVLTEEAGKAFIKYLEEYIRVEDLDASPKAVDSIYGANYGKTPYRPTAPAEPREDLPTMIRETDGTVKEGKIDDIVPF